MHSEYIASNVYDLYTYMFNGVNDVEYTLARESFELIFSRLLVKIVINYCPVP